MSGLSGRANYMEGAPAGSTAGGRPAENGPHFSFFDASGDVAIFAEMVLSTAAANRIQAS